MAGFGTRGTGAGERLALVELAPSHEETLHAQIHWLADAGHRVHLVGHPRLVEGIAERDRLAGSLVLEVRSRKVTPWSAFAAYRRLHRYCREHGIRRLVFNTCETTVVRYLVFFARFGGLRCDGILHNGSKLGTSRLFRSLARFHLRHILVMHDSVLRCTAPVPGVAVDSFYPIYYPSHPAEPGRADDRFRVVIVGVVVRARKDSMALARQLRDVPLDPAVSIEILGSADRDLDPEVYDALAATPVFGAQLRCSPGFKDPADVHRELLRADLLLPLLYPRGQDRFYADGRVSGAVNLAFGYRIPMLLHDSWRGVPDYDVTSFFHGTDQLVQRINELARDRGSVARMKAAIAANPKLDPAYQGRRYLRFLGLES